jgi:uncharacterized Ntn-hydrolase superfamily protein
MTYSLVARDPATGELGVAVQTKAFAVGSVVPWAESGVGAVATQSFSERSYGPLGLELMRAGREPELALAALVTADKRQQVRQVGMVDAEGRAAAHTGERCIAEAGHVTGDGFSVQANMMASSEVWPAMAETLATARGSFAERLLAALDAGEEAGGDFRGRRTAAILVVSAQSSGRPWDDRVIDLRVDDSEEPLVELRRLVLLSEAYRRLGTLEGEVPAEEIDRARGAGVRDEDLEWYAVTAAWRGGDLEAARSRLEALVARNPLWEGAWPMLRDLPPPGAET